MASTHDIQRGSRRVVVEDALEERSMKTPESITVKAREATTLLEDGADGVQQYLTKLYAEESRDDLADDRKRRLSDSRVILEEWQSRFLVCKAIIKGEAMTAYSHTGEVLVNFQKRAQQR